MQIRVNTCRLAKLIGVAAAWIAGSVAADEGAKDSVSKAADRMIASCLEHATANKLPPLSIVIVDATGAIIAAKRQDGAPPASADAALLKARTATRAKAPTAALTSLVAQDQATRDVFLVLGLTGIPGGIPFALGAVGVSGAEPGQDASCAQRAVDAVGNK
nr:heme-binding protein [uncultured Steroidobacter sp.]